MIKSGKVRGTVQNVMFRQTFIRALQKKGLRGGATNNVTDKNEVLLTMEGDSQLIQELADKLKTKEKLNSWGALVEEFQELPEIIPIKNHQVTTENVDNFNWTPNVEMYL